MKKRLPPPAAPLLPEFVVGVMAGFLTLILIAALRFMAAPEPDQIFNFCEGLVWTAIAGVLLVRSRKFPHLRKVMLGAGVTFFLFGVSDFIEIRTRAWYEPWTLLAFKIACVISLVIHFVLYRRQKSAPRHEDLPS